MQKKIQQYRWWIIGLVALLLFIFFVPLTQVAKTGAVYVNFLFREGAWRPLQIFTADPEIRSVTITLDSGKNLAADLYLPTSSGGPFPGIVLFNPVVFDFTDDPRITNLSQTFARSGFVVLAPGQPVGQEGLISIEDRASAQAAYQYLLTLPEVDAERVGYFGLSYGAAPAFFAAVQQQPAPAFFAAYGAFADIQSQLKYAITGAYSYNEISGVSQPDPWVRDFVIAALQSTFPENAALNDLLANTDPEQFDRLYANLPGVIKEELNKLSPLDIIEDLSSPLYLLHSTDDNVVPYTESMKLRDAAPALQSFSLVSVFQHGDFKPLTTQTFVKDYLPSLRSSLRFLWHVLKPTAR